MFENITKFFNKFKKTDGVQEAKSKDTAKERLHLVLMQDRANVSADFLEMMKQEIIEVIKKYIDVDENAIDVRLTNKTNDDGTNGAPALYANIPIISIRDEKKAEVEAQVQEKNANQKAEEQSNKENGQDATKANTQTSKEDKAGKENKDKENKNNKESKTSNKVQEKEGKKNQEKQDENIEEKTEKSEATAK